MVSDLSLKFPEDIATNIKRMAIDLTNGDDEQIYRSFQIAEGGKYHK